MPGVQLVVGPLRAHAPLGKEDPAPQGKRGQGLKTISDPRYQGDGKTGEKAGNIRTRPAGNLRPSRIRNLRGKPPKQCGPVAAPRPQAGTREKAFQDLYIQRGDGKARFPSEAQGPRDDVLPLQLHPLDVDEVSGSRIGAPEDAQRLPRGDPEEEGDEVVIAVIPTPGHP